MAVSGTGGVTTTGPILYAVVGCGMKTDGYETTQTRNLSSVERIFSHKHRQRHAPGALCPMYDHLSPLPSLVSHFH